MEYAREECANAGSTLIGSRRIAGRTGENLPQENDPAEDQLRAALIRSGDSVIVKMSGFVPEKSAGQSK